jgi:hypothetical protein
MDMAMKLCRPPSEEQRLRVFESRVLRKYLGLRERKQEETGEKCIIGVFIMYM